MTIVVLVVAAFLTSTLSGVLGMGGGITLVGVMAAVLPAPQVVPLHGVVQLCSNLTRTVVFLPHVRWRYVAVCAPFLVLGVVGATAVWSGDLSWFKPFIGLFLLLFLASRGFARSLRLPPLWLYAPLGAVTGFLAMFVGATGPFIAPFFLRDDFAKEEVIATKAMCQSFTHVLKIPAFLALGFNYLEHIELLALLVPMVILGTVTGKKLLGHLDQRTFERLFVVLLAVLALHLLAGSLLRAEDEPVPGVGSSAAPEPEEMAASALTSLQGLLSREPTVGYRSPYRLQVTEGPPSHEVELRGEAAMLDPHLGATVRLVGRFVVIPGGSAELGSEAASRFVEGQVPGMRWFEVESLTRP